MDPIISFLIGALLFPIAYLLRHYVPVALGELPRRGTFASNTLYQERLKALTTLWTLVIDAVYLLSPDGHFFETWRENKGAKADAFLLSMKQEIERQQILLDKEIIHGFWRVYIVMAAFSRDESLRENGHPMTFGTFYTSILNPRLLELAYAVNKHMRKTTHTVSLDPHPPTIEGLYDAQPNIPLSASRRIGNRWKKITKRSST